MQIQNWNFDYPGFETLSCQAPCTMYSVLLDHKKIPDPFYGRNEEILTSLADRDCSFSASFEVTEDQLKEDFAELTFYGLDTICTITLNGQTLDSVKNMHRTYVYEVKKLLQIGTNAIRLDFKSPTRFFEKMHKHHYLYSNDGCTIPGAAHLRKASLFISFMSKEYLKNLYKKCIKNTIENINNNFSVIVLTFKQ